MMPMLLLLLGGCTTIDSLKPGTPRGTIDESDFMQTTAGLSLTVRGHVYDEVWAAAAAAMTRAGMLDAWIYSERLVVFDTDKARGVIRSEAKTRTGATWAYVGVFIRPTTPHAAAYVVEVSKVLKSWAETTEGRDWEAALLRAIQAVVGGK